jgi:hypothetical protein
VLVLKSGSTQCVLISVDAVAVGEIGHIKNDYLPTVLLRSEKALDIPGSQIVINAIPISQRSSFPVIPMATFTIALRRNNSKISGVLKKIATVYSIQPGSIASNLAQLKCSKVSESKSNDDNSVCPSLRFGVPCNETHGGSPCGHRSY